MSFKGTVCLNSINIKPARMKENHCIKPKNTVLLIALVVLISVLGNACKRDRNHPGYAYFPDMAYSEGYETYSENPVFRDGKTMQGPVEGTVPREMIPYQYSRSFEDQLLAGQELINPKLMNETSLKNGKFQYDIFCSSCHGDRGKGNGHLYTSKLFPAKPTSLVEDYVQNKPDGEIYHVITLGSISGLMGAHGSQISSDDRWDIINYVKNNCSVKPQ
jgi:mono/diheme cytochrome c family protein